MPDIIRLLKENQKQWIGNSDMARPPGMEGRAVIPNVPLITERDKLVGCNHHNRTIRMPRK